MERQIMLILAHDHIGQENRINRQRLCSLIANKFGLTGKSRATVDRQVRKTIESLQSQGYPILSDSGQGGYWLGRRSEVAEYLAEQESRINALTDKVRSLRRADKLSWIDPPKPPGQSRFW
jgi:biotin operon repressor